MLGERSGSKRRPPWRRPACGAATERRRRSERRSDLLVCLEIPASLGRRIQRAVRLLRLVLVLDLAEVERDLILGNDVAVGAAAGLKGAHEQIAELDREELLLIGSRLAAGELRRLDVLPCCAGEHE